MSLRLTAIQQLAPDEASLKAAKGLVAPTKWPHLGRMPRRWCQTLSKALDDPVDLHFGVQLGGGTDINRAVS